jgi:hypothetical protein
MKISVHQPIFLPWPGFFYKAIRSDLMVLLDNVQFPRGGSWLTRNRLKNEDGTLWLTVPVLRKGRDLQLIREVEIYRGRPWLRKHLRCITQNYANAPYLEKYFEAVESIYRGEHRYLWEFNFELIRFLAGQLCPETKFLLQSDLGVGGSGTGLLINICQRLKADQFCIFPIVEKHIDTELMQKRGIELSYVKFNPPVYPQLWGKFIYNLSALDLLLNCGPAGRKIVSRD